MARQFNTLFLHYGPGGNAFVEREILARSFPEVDFWDQPDLKDKENVFEHLVKASEDRGLELQKLNPQGIKLWAHSFGCQIAVELLRRQKIKINNVSLVSPLSNVPLGFLGLALRLRNDSKTPNDLGQDLDQAIEKFKKAPGQEAVVMWDLVGVIARDPGFGRLYWHSQDAYETFANVASKGPPLNFGMWANVLQDYLKVKPAIQKELIPKNTEVILGKFDPYILDIEKERGLWQSLVPKEKIKILEQGHNCHLEGELLTK